MVRSFQTPEVSSTVYRYGYSYDFGIVCRHVSGCHRGSAHSRVPVWSCFVHGTAEPQNNVDKMGFVVVLVIDLAGRWYDWLMRRALLVLSCD